MIVINVQERYKMGTVREEVILSRVISLMVRLQRRGKAWGRWSPQTRFRRGTAHSGDEPSSCWWVRPTRPRWEAWVGKSWVMSLTAVWEAGPQPPSLVNWAAPLFVVRHRWGRMHLRLCTMSYDPGKLLSQTQRRSYPRQGSQGGSGQKAMSSPCTKTVCYGHTMRGSHSYPWACQGANPCSEPSPGKPQGEKYIFLWKLFFSYHIYIRQ